MTSEIERNPEYIASINKVDEAIREHHALLERIGNEGEIDQESSVVDGWVLVIGQLGMNDDGPFHGDLTELSPRLNPYTAVGLARSGVRFLESNFLVD